MGIFDKLIQATVVKTVDKVANIFQIKAISTAEKVSEDLETKKLENEMARIEALSDLKNLYDTGAISWWEYNKEKKRLMNK